MFSDSIREKRIEKNLFSLFQLIISFLFSIILTGQLFGVLRIYKNFIVIPFTIVLTITLLWFWRNNNITQNTNNEFEVKSFPNSQNYRNLSFFTYIFVLLLLLLIIIPILNWPNNTMEKELNWDAGEYHFPKAIEQYRSGSAWDFSISYGEYPFGYESLLSFDLLLTNDLSLFSTSHVLITLLFVFSSWFLLKKYSKFPPAILLLTFIFLLLSGFLPFFNPWSSLRYTIFTIGKNDLFLAAATIAAIYFSQIRKPKEETRIDWIGLGLSSSIALSIKPNSILVIIFLWVISIYKGWGFKLKNLHNYKLFYGIFLASTGGIWIIRNLLGQGKLFNESTYNLATHSIFSRLSNPDFINHVPNTLIFSFVIVGLTFICVLIKSCNLNWYDFGLLFVTFISFVITPASTDPNNPTLIAWRFGIILLVLQFILLVKVIEPALMPLIKTLVDKKITTISLILLISIPVFTFMYWQRDLLRFVPEKSDILIRPYAVENKEYKSVFDYINENIDNSIVWVEGAQSFYAYDPEFSNSITRNIPADYIIFVNFEKDGIWIKSEEWSEIYSDEFGRIFERISDP